MTKSKNKRAARKQGNKWVSDATKDSMRAARRKYGTGMSR